MHLPEPLLHLADLIEQHRDTIDVRLMPFTATERSIFSGATFHLIDFADPRLPTLGWHESSVMGELLEDRDKETRVRDLGVIHDRAMAQAMGREATLDRIRAIAGGLESLV
ncbi:Scr1 family TA system antitoxin-like transcriptional regulator [Nocardia vinacea]|uniref:Scr1 family TA system antitoxin-like transcriptional regulator n=1 Tax=Nocardia vinacea TaxID=96468 RepID=UPI0033FA6334